MDIRYNVEKIKEIIDNLYGLTGLSFNFRDMNDISVYRRVRDNDEVCLNIQSSPAGRTLCVCSDLELALKCKKEKKPVSHICHAGLLDTAVPIMKNHAVVGILFIGRIRPNFENGEAPPLPVQEYSMMSTLTKEQYNSLISLISNIIFENAIDVECDVLISRTLEYIDKNIASDLSVANLCEYLYTSKNSLYRAFRSHFGCTVNEYIAKRRISKAAKLLRESNENVTAIAESVGIRNYTYFSRLFKKIMAMSPIQYRKSGDDTK